MKDNKVIIVTGGTGNLGRVIVDYLSETGNKIYVPAQNIDKFRNIFDKSQKDNNYRLNKVFGFECDASKSDSVKEFINSVSKLENGKIDCLINTIGGIHKSVNIVDSDENVLDTMIDLNFRSTYYFSKETAKVMKANKYGRIISISSLASLKIPKGLYYYGFTKTAVNQLMDTISEELKQFNVRCNTIIPGTIDTPSNREWGSEEDIKKWISPIQIAKVIHHLISEDFDSIHSSDIKILGNY